MGGMFTMLKVRKDQAAGDYKDPGWFKQPPGTQAFEWAGTLPEPARFKSEVASGGAPVTGLHNPPAQPANATPAKSVELVVRKPGAGKHKH
jgi:hypothetical protein